MLLHWRRYTPAQGSLELRDEVDLGLGNNASAPAGNALEGAGGDQRLFDGSARAGLNLFSAALSANPKIVERLQVSLRTPLHGSRDAAV